MLSPRATYAATKSFLVTFSELLHQELKDTGSGSWPSARLRAHRVHPVQGMDTSHLPFVPDPQTVVDAALAGLEQGELFRFPTMEDTTPLQRLLAAEAELVGGGRSATLASPYGRSQSGRQSR